MNDPENTYYWLKRGENHYHYTIQLWMSRMNTEVGAGNFTSAFSCLEELKSVCQMADELDQASVHVECALAAFRMHAPVISEKELDAALNLLRGDIYRSQFHAHIYAVAYWILGNLQTSPSNPVHTPVKAWLKSLETFTNLAFRPGLIDPECDWYLDRCAEMQQAIKDATSGIRGKSAWSSVLLQSGRLAYFDIFEEFSIGRFGLPGVVIKLPGQINLQPSMVEFSIANQPHRLHSLRGLRRLLVLDSTRNYCVLKVNGDWMNRVGISSGDFVLVRLLGKKEKPEDGDIVAVEIFNLHPSAIIYQLSRKESWTVLSAQSVDTNHLTYKFAPDENDQYYIHGVVLGVFKQTEQMKNNQREEQELRIETDYLLLGSFPVYEEIPAGEPDILPKNTGDHLEAERFIINHQPYYIKNLRKPGKAINTRSGSFIILKVKGDSMNDPKKADIQDGDYVLVRLQNNAEDGDIVAAEISEEDDFVTLKHYKKSNDTVELAPESTEPKYQAREFKKIKGDDFDPDPSFKMDGVTIKGIAIGVLKPYT